MKESDFVSLYL